MPARGQAAGNKSEYVIDYLSFSRTTDGIVTTDPITIKILAMECVYARLDKTTKRYYTDITR